ncbi:MAG: DUF4382 domain-containing protein [Bacteroidales bacterium]|nr:DUF4382 domain-containing protein [Bacteroidales bacterium]
MKKLSGILVVFLAVFFISSCSTDESVKLSVHLTDAPGEFDALYIDVQGIEVNIGGEDVDDWLILDVEPTVFNLLDFTNGLDTLLGTVELEPGKISQIRLILGENCSIVNDGVETSLEVPSGETSGLKLNVHKELLAGVSYHLWIDFDAERSIVEDSKGFKLKPVLRVFTDAISGAISGVVLPQGVQPYVFAVVGEDTIGTIADELGNFLLKGVSEGSYQVTFDGGEIYELNVVEGVEVVNGEVTDMGTLNLVEL